MRSGARRRRPAGRAACGTSSSNRRTSSSSGRARSFGAIQARTSVDFRRNTLRNRPGQAFLRRVVRDPIADTAPAHAHGALASHVTARANTSGGSPRRTARARSHARRVRDCETRKAASPVARLGQVERLGCRYPLIAFRHELAGWPRPPGCTPPRGVQVAGRRPFTTDRAVFSTRLWRDFDGMLAIARPHRSPRPYFESWARDPPRLRRITDHREHRPKILSRASVEALSTSGES